MADLKITQLPSASIATGSNVLPIVQGGVTDQITVTNLGQGIFNLGLPITASSVSSSGGFTGSLSGVSTDARNILVNVLNQSGYDIAKGLVVRITGSNNSSDIPRIVTASYTNEDNSANTLGITNEAILNGNSGSVITEGILLGINTTGYTSGQLIYLGANGAITGSAPVAPLQAVRLGEIIRQQSNNGSIYVRVDNGYELGELHDVVDNTTTSSYGDLLVKSGSVWINSKQLTGSYGLTGSLNATSITGSFTGSINGAVVDNTAWTSYTPTWTAQVTNPTLGNGTITGAYKVIGKTCFVRITLNYGTTTSGGSGGWLFGLPLTASNADGIQMPCSMLDNGNAWYQGIANGTYSGFTNKTAIICQTSGSNSSQGVYGGFPFVWGNGDSLQSAGSYEIA